MNKIYIIGIGPGHPDYVLPIAQTYINKSDILIGGERNLQIFKKHTGKKVVIKKELSAIVALMKIEKKTQQVALILSGDTGFYSMLSYMKKHFTNDEIEVIPGISSFQYLFAKIKEPWQQTPLLSLHGRKSDYLSLLKEEKQVFLLTDKVYSPDAIAKELIEAGDNKVQMIVGENLSYEEERIVIGSPEEIIASGPYEMSVVVMKNG